MPSLLRLLAILPLFSPFGLLTAQEPSSPTLVPPALLHAPEGLEVTLWAASPLLRNPTNIDFDAQGRLYVAEGVNYRGSPHRRPGGDRIVILEDTNRDGRADQSTVFVEGQHLQAPLGVAVLDHQIVVSQPPDLLVYTMTQPGGSFIQDRDRVEALLTGFGGRQHDHSLHSLTAGPDGLWYFNQGNAGASFTDRGGRRFFMGSPYMQSELAGKRSDDGHVWIGGFTARMRPDGTDVRIIGHNYRNSYEQAVTSFGDVFQSDNDDPPACRVTAILEGGNAGFASADGQRSWDADRRPGQNTPTAEWRQEDPGTMPAGDVYGGGSPTGVAFYENGALGQSWQGLLLVCDAGRNVVFGYHPQPDGAGWKLERFDFLTSNRERAFAGSDFQGGKTNGELKTLFRPSDVCVGPDGAIYVADWFDARVGGHATLDASGSGAIYRIAPRGFRSVAPSLDLATTEGQIAALKSPCQNVRHSGFTRLRAQGAQAVAAVTKLLEDPDPYFQARAVWLLAQMGEAGLARVTSLLDSPDARLRLVAFRALRPANAGVLKLAARLASDENAAVRREVALSLRDAPLQASLPMLLEIGRRFDGLDRAYLEAFGLGCEGKEAQVYEALREIMGGPADSWSPAFAGIAWRLHPATAATAFRDRARLAQLELPERRRMVDALAFVSDPRAAGHMLELAADTTFPLRELALWWLFNRKNNTWREAGLEAGMKKLGLYDPDKIQLVAVPLPPEPPAHSGLPSVEAIDRMPGDARRGEIAASVCLTCHKIGAAGVEFGPELSGFGRQQTSSVIAQAILNPSADIAHGYEASEVITTEGSVIAGILLSKGDPVILKCMGGMVQTIPQSRVRTLKKSRRSLMLAPSQLGLDGPKIADIIAYLKSL